MTGCQEFWVKGLVEGSKQGLIKPLELHGFF